MNAPHETSLPILLREDSGGVAKLTLNRPSQFNSLSEEMLIELQSALDAIAGDPAVRVVVIGGAGKAFCAGHDLKQMRANHSKAYMQKLFKQCGRMMMRIVEMPQPVIARVHGIATAAGCQLVAMCDLAVAGEGARFAVSGINLGLFCSTPSVALGRAMLFNPHWPWAAAAKLGGQVTPPPQYARSAPASTRGLFASPKG